MNKIQSYKLPRLTFFFIFGLTAALSAIIKILLSQNDSVQLPNESKYPFLGEVITFFFIGVFYIYQEVQRQKIIQLQKEYRILQKHIEFQNELIFNKENKIHHQNYNPFLLNSEELKLTSRKKDFINKIISIVEQNITDNEFGVENLAKKVGLSTSQLNRKVKAITNQTTVKIIRSIKLRKAYEMLRADTDNIAGIAYSTGFETPGYFTKVFKQYFGFLPSDKDKIKEKPNHSASETTF